MNDRNDRQNRQLRELLGLVGRDAEYRGPEFRRVWAAARLAHGVTGAKHGRKGTTWALAAGLGAIVFVGVVIHWLHLPPESVSVANLEPMNSALVKPYEMSAEEQMPTDFLLSLNDQPWPDSVARLADQIDSLLGL